MEKIHENLGGDEPLKQEIFMGHINIWQEWRPTENDKQATRDHMHVLGYFIHVVELEGIHENWQECWCTLIIDT